MKYKTIRTAEGKRVRVRIRPEEIRQKRIMWTVVPLMELTWIALFLHVWGLFLWWDIAPSAGRTSTFFSRICGGTRKERDYFARGTVCGLMKGRKTTKWQD